MKVILDESGVVSLPHLFPSSMLFLSTIKVGDRLELKHEPNNPKDAYALCIYWNDMPIGYVPNRGYTCSYCLGNRKGSGLCSNCNSSLKVSGGLAYRIIKRGWLESYICLVTKVHVYNAKAPITFNILSTFEPKSDYYEQI